MKIPPTDCQNKVAEIAKERVKELLRKKQPFVFNATNLSPLVRGKQLRRNAARSDAVPEQAICHMMRELVPPEAREAYRVDWHCV